MARAVVYGSACPACRQAEMIFERYGIDVERRPLGELPPGVGRVRGQPQIAIDGATVGGINDLLRLTRTRQLDEVAAGARFAPPPRAGTLERLGVRRQREQ